MRIKNNGFKRTKHQYWGIYWVPEDGKEELSEDVGFIFESKQDAVEFLIKRFLPIEEQRIAEEHNPKNEFYSPLEKGEKDYWKITNLNAEELEEEFEKNNWKDNVKDLRNEKNLDRVFLINCIRQKDYLDDKLKTHAYTYYYIAQKNHL